MCNVCAVCSRQYVDISISPQDLSRHLTMTAVGQLVNQSTHLLRVKTKDSLIDVVTCDQCILLDKSVSSTHWIMFTF